MQTQAIFFKHTLSGHDVLAGKIVDGIAFLSARDAKAHLYRGGAKTVNSAIKNKTASWGINKDVLEEVKGRGVKIVIIADKYFSKYFWVALKKFDSVGATEVDMGHGAQRHILFHEWNEAEDVEQLISVAKKVLFGKG